jgi:soluble lytic murein transglycosylase-like protein
MGIHYFSRLLSDFNDDPWLALTAYNYGPTYVRSLMERKKRVPSNYYNKVLTVYRTL